MEVSAAEKEMYIETVKELKGSAKRVYMARVVKALGRGGQAYAEGEFGWNRETIRKGSRELATGFICYDNFSARGRKRVEEKFPNLRADIKEIAERHSQTDPKFQGKRLYLRLSTASVRRLLIEENGYTDEALPCEETIRKRLNELDYHPKRIKKVNH